MLACSSTWWPSALQHHLWQQALVQLYSCQVGMKESDQILFNMSDFLIFCELSSLKAILWLFFLLFRSSPGVDTVSSSQAFASRYQALIPPANLYLNSPWHPLIRMHVGASEQFQQTGMYHDPPPPKPLSLCVSQISPTHSAPAPSSPSPSPQVTPSATHQEVRLVFGGSFTHFSVTSFCNFSRGEKVTAHVFFKLVTMW